ncbi:MAG TPA: glycosyltransferase [Steroidobacter sp.]|nr:glycosyltransferase [Steroidobacter sp.]
MKFVLFYHSLASDWNHGNAHFLRGVASELLARGHAVKIYEPENGWSRRNLVEQHGHGALDRFAQAFPELSSRAYERDSIDLDEALDDADVVIVHEWNDPALVARIGAHAAGSRARVFFHDTHHRSATDPNAIAAFDLRHYDGVLAFGKTIAERYVENGWSRAAWVWHEAADVRRFRPLEDEACDGDLVWIGNWGDGERGAELEQFLIEPVERLNLRARIYGVRYPDSALQALRQARIEYGGWIANYAVPRIFARYRCTVHVPRGAYARILRGVPTIRMFEALACGIPLVSAPWDDAEKLFRPGFDYLVAGNGREMERRLRAVLNEPALAAALRANGLATIHARHTCAHRIDELLAILGALRPVACEPAASVSTDSVQQTQPGVGNRESEAAERLEPQQVAPPKACVFGPGTDDSRTTENGRWTKAAGSSHDPRAAARKPTIAMFGSSLVSAYWNGAATYYRGVIRALHTLGFEITFYEPDAYGRQAHRDIPDPDFARVVVYEADESGVCSALERAQQSDILIKASGVGVFDELLEAEVARLGGPTRTSIFWDVDAPATLARLRADPADPFLAHVRRFDLVLTYGGGAPVVREYTGFGARRCAPIYNALDPATHHPVAPDPRFAGDLAFLGNRLPDREARVREFFLEPARRLPGKRFILGGAGWEKDIALTPNVAAIGHVYTREHNAFNCSAGAVININRDSMADVGYSPPTRVFEAAGAAACLLCDAWAGIDEFLEPGKEVLCVASSDDVVERLAELSDEDARRIGGAARRRVLAQHTYAHRAEELRTLLDMQTLRTSRESRTKEAAVRVSAD